MAVSWSHKAVAFAKSRVMLGSLSGIDRARVCALQNPDEDRPLAAHFRVSWCDIAAIFVLEFIFTLVEFQTNLGSTARSCCYR